MALATTLGGARAAPLQEALDRLEFDAALARHRRQGRRRRRTSSATSSSEPDLSDADLWRALHRKTPEAVVVAGALGAGAAAAERWLTDVRHRRLAITGDDFVAAGLSGPAVGDALEAAQLAALAGEAPGAEQQLAAGLAAVRPS